MDLSWLDWIFGPNLRLPGGDDDPPAGEPTDIKSPGLGFMDWIFTLMGDPDKIPGEPTDSSLGINEEEEEEEEGEPWELDPKMMRLMFSLSSFETLSSQFNNPYFSLAAIPMFGLFMMGRYANPDEEEDEDDETDDDDATDVDHSNIPGGLHRWRRDMIDQIDSFPEWWLTPTEEDDDVPGNYGPRGGLRR
jgi:hypothetical protein